MMRAMLSLECRLAAAPALSLLTTEALRLVRNPKSAIRNRLDDRSFRRRFQFVLDAAPDDSAREGRGQRVVEEERVRREHDAPEVRRVDARYLQLPRGELEQSAERTVFERRGQARGREANG